MRSTSTAFLGNPHRGNEAATQSRAACRLPNRVSTVPTAARFPATSRAARSSQSAGTGARMVGFELLRAQAASRGFWWNIPHPCHFCSKARTHFQHNPLGGSFLPACGVARSFSRPVGTGMRLTRPLRTRPNSLPQKLTELGDSTPGRRQYVTNQRAVARSRSLAVLERVFGRWASFLDRHRSIVAFVEQVANTARNEFSIIAYQ